MPKRPHPEKEARRAIREMAVLAYERHLGTELQKVRDSFAEWEAGRLSAFELAERIHEFHQHPARELYNLYMGPGRGHEILIARAIIDKHLTESDLPEIIRQNIMDLAFLMASQAD